ncbi:type II toxin-antitoxin system RelE/ParE family toxin [Sphingomonas sp. CV7422]|uniref:type II toxin-antitoxin system RelE/ParE family toxin n=1 Tax=Sphingomonas sp. CV7422 TaxID=3018036 RepID=UPI0022FECC41|nr:type II toxin-antitoxin system RelE/ParE family toxin [Sphingomonas sp. CV7422]
MTVRFTDHAERELEEIGDFIARDDPWAAGGFVAELRAKCLDLGDFPRRFPIVRQAWGTGIRRRIHKRYVILYRIDDDAVVILHIVHSARDYGDLL